MNILFRCLIWFHQTQHHLFFYFYSNCLMFSLLFIYSIVAKIAKQYWMESTWARMVYRIVRNAIRNCSVSSAPIAIVTSVEKYCRPAIITISIQHAPGAPNAAIRLAMARKCICRAALVSRRTNPFNHLILPHIQLLASCEMLIFGVIFLWRFVCFSLASTLWTVSNSWYYDYFEWSWGHTSQWKSNR